jgi:hypothetical protein
MPDAAVDTVAGPPAGPTTGKLAAPAPGTTRATAALRPVLAVDGTARVTALRGDGEVVDDAVVAGAFPVPVGTALIAVQADGVVAPGDGLAGWHAATRVCALGAHAALAPGCVVTSSGAPTTRGVTWMTAASLTSGAATVVTRFATPVATVALVLEDGGADRVDGVDLDLAGARRARAADGSAIAATVVHAGAHLVMIFAVEALDADPSGAPAAAPVAPPTAAPAGATVRVRAGGDWLVTGVLGAAGAVADVVDAVVRGGVAGAASRLLSATGNGCSLQWKDPAASRAVPDRAGVEGAR